MTIYFYMNTELDKIYNYCFRILGLKPYTESEIRKKIYGRFKNVEEETINEVVAKLIELKYVDDKKFIENYVEYRSSISPRGVYLLKQELYRKGINSDLISEVLNKIEIDEIKLAQELANHKLQSLQSYEPQKRKEKLMRFLQSRGFGYDVIKEVI